MPKTLSIDNQISLRVHFKMQSEKSVDEILDLATQLKSDTNKKFTINIVDEHIWLGISKKQQKMYSPNLHLELEKKADNHTEINAKFGPDPSLWTLFMFLHFGLALLFITVFIIGYANYSLGKSYVFQLLAMSLIAMIWVGLYVFARVNRSRGNEQAQYLFDIASKIV